MKEPKLHNGIRCMNCGYQLDSVADLEGEKFTPSVGDVSICLECGNIAEFVQENNKFYVTDIAPDKITYVKKHNSEVILIAEIFRKRYQKKKKSKS